MEKTEVRERVENYIKSDILGGNEDKVKLLEEEQTAISSILDSLSIVKLLVFLEEDFDISLDTELDMENFSSLDSISEMVLRCIALAKKEQ